MEKRKEQLSNNDDDDDDDDDNEYYYYFPLFTFDELQTSTYQSSKNSFYENWICHASLDSAVNRPDSKARACPEARHLVYLGSTIHL